MRRSSKSFKQTSTTRSTPLSGCQSYIRYKSVCLPFLIWRFYQQIQYHPHKQEEYTKRTLEEILNFNDSVLSNASYLPCLVVAIKKHKYVTWFCHEHMSKINPKKMGITGSKSQNILTASSHLKMDGWNTFSFPFGMTYFQVLRLWVSGRVLHTNSRRYLSTFLLQLAWAATSHKCQPASRWVPRGASFWAHSFLTDLNKLFSMWCQQHRF